jgi:hypothetical protein
MRSRELVFSRQFEHQINRRHRSISVESQVATEIEFDGHTARHQYAFRQWIYAAGDSPFVAKLRFCAGGSTVVIDCQHVRKMCEDLHVPSKHCEVK